MTLVKLLARRGGARNGGGRPSTSDPFLEEVAAMEVFDVLTWIATGTEKISTLHWALRNRTRRLDHKDFLDKHFKCIITPDRIFVVRLK